MAVEHLALRRSDFLPEAWSILVGIEEALHGLTSPEAATAQRLLLVLTHRMAGSAAMFGLEAAAEVADAMETAAQRLAAGVDREATARFLGESLTRLTRLFEEEPAPLAADPLVRELRELARHEPEVLEYFLPEMREHLDEAEEALVRLSRTELLAPADVADAVGAVFRRIHTLKGAAFVVGCRPVGELAHRMEEILVVARAQPARFDAAGARTALAAVDVLHRMAEVLAGQPANGDLAHLRDAVLGPLANWGAALATEAPEPPPAAPPGTDPSEPAAAAEETVPAGRKTEGRGAPGLRLQLRAVDELVHFTGELLAVRNRLQGEIEQLEALREQRQASVERLRRTLRDFSGRHLDPVPAISGSLSQPAPLPPESFPAVHFSALELDRYDDFNVLARRLDEITADLAEEESEEAELARQLAAGADDLRRWVDDLHAGVGRLRLVPISQIFGRCARLVRRAASTAGKEIGLEVAGERVEIDAAIAEQIWEPLLHLIQNAVDHAFEPEETRRALGKPAAGRLTLRAVAEGRRVIVDVEDDGAGIDPGRIRLRAQELKLRPAAELERLDGRGALELIFLPGFSSLAVATASSGRGVGLDVVRTTLERLGGSVEVSSTAGGTRFRLAFPLTLVVSEALLVRAGEEIVALPATAVERIVEADLAAGAPPLEHKGEPAPVIDLARVLGSVPQRSGERSPAAIVGSPGRWRALLVDEVMGSETAVLRPLGPFFARFDLFSGALLTREGRLRLLLNTQAAITAGALHRPAAAPEAPRRALRVVLADDSVSVRKVMGGILAQAGYDVALAADGEEAMELLEASPCDLLVTDLEMPRRNGYELLAWVRRRPATARLPAVVVTTRVGEKHQELARQVGATVCLSKPVGEELLLRTVAGLAAYGKRSDL
jgi:chemosensory pili system protein ChpA (sensor histidine kinase/response regulator)